MQESTYLTSPSRRPSTPLLSSPSHRISSPRRIYTPVRRRFDSERTLQRASTLQPSTTSAQCISTPHRSFSALDFPTEETEILCLNHPWRSRDWLRLSECLAQKQDLSLAVDAFYRQESLKRAMQDGKPEIVERWSKEKIRHYARCLKAVEVRHGGRTLHHRYKEQRRQGSAVAKSDADWDMRKGSPHRIRTKPTIRKNPVLTSVSSSLSSSSSSPLSPRRLSTLSARSAPASSVDKSRSSGLLASLFKSWL
ncbi:hypothetical protein BCR43DRAFT_486700, partial [Syncephalastrum racemosum]